MRSLARSLRLLIALTSFGCSDGDPDPVAPVPVTLHFELNVAGEPFACGQRYANVGSPPADFTPTDARFYAYDFALVGAEGTNPIELDESSFQGQGVALLDFEDGCGPDGTAELNSEVTGIVVPGNFSGVRFTLGLPPEQNFIDLVSAAPPLDVSGMYWTWQFGYKFLKVDGSVPSSEGGINPFLVHVGASGCPGTNAEAPPDGDCQYPNRVTYTLEGASNSNPRVTADLGAILALSDLSTNTDGTAPGCMSEPDDPECDAVFDRLGVNDARDQSWLNAD